MILLSTLFFAGCSSVFGEDPTEQADRAIIQANEDISAHNRLFGDARDAYAEIRREIEAGDAAGQEDRITGARDTMQEARGRLREARSSLGRVDDLEVDPTVRRYTDLLSGAMETQISAESSEIEFYDLLLEDPALEENRQEALDLLDEVGARYEEAGDSYAAARELADSNPRLIETN